MRVVKSVEKSNKFLELIKIPKIILKKIDLWIGSKNHVVTYKSSKKNKNRIIGYFLILFVLIYLQETSSVSLYERTKNIPVVGFLNFLNIKYEIFMDFLMVLLVLKLYGSFKYILPFSLPVFFYKNKLDVRLQRVIRSNKLYNSYNQEGVEVVENSVKFIYRYDDIKLYIGVYSGGANYTTKIQDLSIILGSALGICLESIDNSDPQSTLYIFRRKEVERIHVNENVISSVLNDTVIDLDSEVSWDFSKIPHAIIAGTTGSGKSTFINYLLIEFLKKGADVYICDPKRSDLYSFKDFFTNGKVASTPNQIAKIMREVNDKMNSRYEKFNNIFQGNFKSYNLRPIVIFFDEVAAFMEEDKKVSSEVDRYLKQIIMKGRQMGVFMLLSTQKPTAEAINTSIRDQMGLRVALGRMQPMGLKMALGDFEEDLPKAQQGIGSGYYYLDGMGWTTPRPFKAPYLDSKEVDFIKALKLSIKYSKNIEFVEE